MKISLLISIGNEIAFGWLLFIIQRVDFSVISTVRIMAPNVCVYSRDRIRLEPLYCGHLGDLAKCPHFRGKFRLTEHIWDIASVLNADMSLFQGCPFRGFHCMQRIG